MKFNKIFSVLACTALLGAAYGCTEKVEPTPSPVAGNEEVYFPMTDPATISIPVNATQISVTVNRVDATEESTVALTSAVSYVDEANNAVPVTDIFTIPASITFPKDVKEISLEIGVDFEKVEIGREYLVDLTLEEAKTGSYGLSHRVFTAMYEPWSEWELVSKTDPGTYTVAMLADGYFKGGVYTRKSLVSDKLVQYSMILPYEDLGIAEDQAQMIFTVDEGYTIEVDGVQCPVVKMEGSVDMAYAHPSTGKALFYTTLNTYYLEYYKGGGQFESEEALYAAMLKSGLDIPYYNPVQGRLYLYMIMFNEDNAYGDITLETMQLPGNYRDYYFSFNYEGNVVDADDVEFALVQIVPSTDVDHFLYGVLPWKVNEETGNFIVPTQEEISAAQDALAADPNAEYIYDATYTVKYAFPHDGKYTVYAIGFDGSNEIVCRASQKYTFETRRVAQEWTPIGSVEYSDGLFVGLFLNAAGASTWDVQAEERIDKPGYYRLKNPYATWPMLDYMEWPYLQGKNYYMEIDASQANAVLMPISELGLEIPEAIDEEGTLFGEARVMSSAWFNINYNGSTLAAERRKGNCGKFVDNCVTFPTAGLYLVSEVGSIFYANTDPERPKDKPVTYGEGYFLVDFSPAFEEASAQKVGRKRTALPSAAQMKKMLDTRSRVNGSVKVRKNVPSDEEVREARMKQEFKGL